MVIVPLGLLPWNVSGRCAWPHGIMCQFRYTGIGKKLSQITKDSPWARRSPPYADDHPSTCLGSPSAPTGAMNRHPRINSEGWDHLVVKPLKPCRETP